MDIFSRRAFLVKQQCCGLQISHLESLLQGSESLVFYRRRIKNSNSLACKMSWGFHVPN